MELLRISERVRAYAYLVLSSQASARSRITGNMVSVLTAQKAFLNNFENIVNWRVDIQKDIKQYQNSLSYASSKVDYSVRESIYMFPSDMNLNIKLGTTEYYNKILVSDSKFSLGGNNMVKTSVPIHTINFREVCKSDWSMHSGVSRFRISPLSDFGTNQL